MSRKIGDPEYKHLVAMVSERAVMSGRPRLDVEETMDAILEARPLDAEQEALWAGVQGEIKRTGTIEEVQALGDLVASYDIYRSLIGPSQDRASISHPFWKMFLETLVEVDVNLAVSDFHGREITTSRRLVISPQVSISGEEEDFEVILSNEFFTGVVHNDRFFMITEADSRDLSLGSATLLRSILEELGFAKNRAVFHGEIIIDPALKGMLPERIANARSLRGYSMKLDEEDTWEDLIPTADHPFAIDEIPFNLALSPELAGTVLDHILTMAQTLKRLGVSVSPATWIYLGFNRETGKVSFDVSAMPTLLDSTLLAGAMARFDGLTPVNNGYYFPNLAAFSTGNSEMMSAEKVLMHMMIQLTRLSERMPPDIDHVTGLALQEFDRYLAYNGFDEQKKSLNGKDRLIGEIIKYYLKTLDFRGLMEFMTHALLPILKERDPVLLMHSSRMFIDEAARRTGSGLSVADFWLDNADNLWGIFDPPEPKRGGGSPSGSKSGGGFGGFGGPRGSGGTFMGQASSSHAVMIPQNCLMAGGTGTFVPAVLGAGIMPANAILPVI